MSSPRKPRNIPHLIGLTGGLGAGKSLVLSLIRAKGIPTLQTDRISHDFLKEVKITKQLSKRFGEGILDSHRKIDRRQLAQFVFHKPNKLRILNDLLHPMIMGKVADWVKDLGRRNRKPTFAVVEVPLLFESGFERFFDGILSVSTSPRIRYKRLFKSGIAVHEMKKREQFQWTQNQKNNKADWVIFNNGSRNDLKYSINQWFELIWKRKKQEFTFGDLTTRKTFGKK